MARYGVTVPIYGAATVWVEAEDEGEALEKAQSGDWIDGEKPEIEEWEISINACRGNICGRTFHNDPRVWEDE